MYEFRNKGEARSRINTFTVCIMASLADLTVVSDLIFFEIKRKITICSLRAERGNCMHK